MGIKRLRSCRGKPGCYSCRSFRQEQKQDILGSDQQPSSVPAVHQLVSDRDYIIPNPVIQWQVQELTTAMLLLHLNESLQPRGLECEGNSNPAKCKAYFYNDSEPPRKKMKMEENGAGSMLMNNAINNSSINDFSHEKTEHVKSTSSASGESSTTVNPIELAVVEGNGGGSRHMNTIVNNTINDLNPSQLLNEGKPNATVANQSKPRAPIGSGKIMTDITNHYKKLSPKDKLAFAERAKEIFQKFAGEERKCGKKKDCKKKNLTKVMKKNNKENN